MLRTRLKRKAQRERSRENFSHRLITVADPANVASEAYRTLRTNLFYALVDNPPRTIALTSPGSTEGKSTTCANLGVVMAQAEKSTLVVDCDLRRPVVHRTFGLRNFRGVVNVLAGEYELQEVVQDGVVPNLSILTVGPIPPNPAELLSSQRFAEFLNEVRQKFDYVLLDAPPIEAVSDAAILATQADGTLLILDAQSTRKERVRQAVRVLEKVGVGILGTVMNNVDESQSVYYYSSYTAR